MKATQLGRGADRNGWLVRSDWHEEQGEMDEARRWRAGADALDALALLSRASHAGERGTVTVGGVAVAYKVCKAEIHVHLPRCIRLHIPRVCLCDGPGLARYLRRKAFEIADSVLNNRKLPFAPAQENEQCSA